MSWTGGDPARLRGRPAIVVFARLPGDGAAKTRLIPVVGVDGAERLHRAFLADTLTVMAATAEALQAEVVLAFAGDGWPGAEVLGPFPRVIPFRQSEGDLGARLAHAQVEVLAAGAAACITVGADSPTLPAGRLAESLAGLDAGADICVAPAEDGGYVLLAVRRPTPEILRAIPWDSDEVLACTRRRAAAAGLGLHLLSGWYDIDDGAGLERLRRELAADPGAAPHAAAALAALAVAPPVRPGP